MRIFLAESNIRIKNVVKEFTNENSSSSVVKLITVPMEESRFKREVEESKPNLIILNIDNYKSPLKELDKYISSEQFKYTSIIITSKEDTLVSKFKTKVNFVKISSYMDENPAEIQIMKDLLSDKYKIFNKIKYRLKEVQKEKEIKKIEKTTKETIEVLSKIGIEKTEKKYANDKNEELDKVIPIEHASIGKKVIAIGSSIGGIEVLNKIITMLPANENIAPIVITQHISGKFTEGMVNRLNNANGNIMVKIGEDSEELLNNTIYVAPGERHMGIERRGTKVVIKIFEDTTMVSRHIPSIDVLYRSVNNTVGRSAMGIILTGMGKDGVKGMGELYKSGAKTLAQEKKSCTVQGIAGDCIVKGYIKKEASIASIISSIIKF